MGTQSDAGPHPPECSIIMPAFNRRPFLANALESLAQQRCRPGAFEVVLVDDGSTDGTREMVAGLQLPYPLHYIHKPNHNSRAEARNRAILAARGPILLFVDCDMLCPPDFVETHLGLQRRYGPCIVAGWHRCLDAPLPTPLPADWLWQVDSRENRRECRPGINTGSDLVPFITANSSCSRADALEVGLFDESFVGYGHEDLDLGYRLHLLGRRTVSDRATLAYHQAHRVEPTRESEVGPNVARYTRKNLSNKRVLHLCQAMVAGGIERFLLSLSRHLHGRQHTFTYGVQRTPEHFEQEFGDLGVEVRQLTAEHIGEYLRSEPFDVIHVHSPRQWLPHLGEWMDRIPVVVTVHSPHPWRALPRPHRVVCGGWGLMRCQPDSPENYYVIECGTDPQAFAPRGVGPRIRSSLGLPDDAFVVGTVARLSDDKISRRMADAYLELLRHAERLHVLLVGGGTTSEYLRERAAELGCAERLWLPGAVSNVADYLEALDLCAHAVEEETFGIAIVEAMANGLPVVAPRLCGPIDTIVEGECGFLCDSMGQFIARVLEFARGEHDMAAMSLNAMKRARRYDERRTALKYKLIYDEAVNGARYWWPPRSSPDDGAAPHQTARAGLSTGAAVR